MEPKTNEELIEVTAKRIYEVMPYDLPGIKPEWVEGGNSLMQSIARGCASGILTTLLTEKDKQREEAVAETRSVGVNDGYKLAVKHLTEAYKQNGATTTAEAIEWLADNARLFTPPTN